MITIIKKSKYKTLLGCPTHTRRAAFFMKEIVWELGENWLVATKYQKLQPNPESCNQI